MTVVKGDPKAPFLIATTPRCRGGHYSFPELLHFTLDPDLIMLSVKQGVIKYHFLSPGYDLTWDWTQVSWAIGEQSNHQAVIFNKTVILFLIWSIMLFWEAKDSADMPDHELLIKILHKIFHQIWFLSFRIFW